ncbi:hypothetical protein [Bacteriophage sp.]|nr:hypothetical protein [Bacteriophage sp.]UOF80140.1 hypothetical protein [Bacteriophage sp.]
MRNYVLRGSGSERGLSYWERWLGCGLAAGMAEGGQTSRAPSFQTTLGTVVHAYAHLYHEQGVTDFSEVEFSFLREEDSWILEEPTWPIVVARATEIMEWWTKTVPAEWLGLVIGGEVPRTLPNHISWLEADIFSSTPRQVDPISSREEREKGPLTGILDLITEVNQGHCDALWERFKLGLQPGRVIWDWKTMAYLGQGVPKLEASYQHDAYRMMEKAYLIGESGLQLEEPVQFVYVAIQHGKGARTNCDLSFTHMPDMVRQDEWGMVYHLRECAMARARKQGIPDKRFCVSAYGQRCPVLTLGCIRAPSLSLIEGEKE